MPTPSLSDLVTPETREEVLALELQIAQTLGLTVTAWQQLGVARTIYATDAANISQLSDTAAFVAQAGWVSYAAQMVDADGNEVRDWMSLTSSEVYNVTREAATYAETDSAGFSISNTTSTSYGPYNPGDLHFSNSTTGAKYHNTETVTIAPAIGSPTPVAIIADEAGSASNASIGQVDTLDTPLVGCACSNSVVLTGNDEETNAALLLRDQAKLGSLSPDGSALAYDFVALSILDPAQPFYNASLSQRITRVKPYSSLGVVNVYIANDAGAPSVGDVAIVNAAIQAWCVPLGVTATVAAATNHSVAVTYTAYVPSAASVTSGEIEAAASAALVAYFKDIPIGGTTDATPNVVPYRAVQGTIFAAIAALVPAYASRISVTLAAPAADVSIATTEVPTLGTVTPTVVLT